MRRIIFQYLWWYPREVRVAEDKRPERNYSDFCCILHFAVGSSSVSCQLRCFGITWCQATSRHLTFWQVTLWTSDLVDFLPLRSSDPLDSWPLWPLAFFPNWPYDSLPFVKLPFSHLTFWFLTFCPNSPVRLQTFCQSTFLDFWPFANLPAFYCWVLTSTGNRLYLKIPKHKIP